MGAASREPGPGGSAARSGRVSDAGGSSPGEPSAPWPEGGRSPSLRAEPGSAAASPCLQGPSPVTRGCHRPRLPRGGNGRSAVAGRVSLLLLPEARGSAPCSSDGGAPLAHWPRGGRRAAPEAPRTGSGPAAGQRPAGQRGGSPRTAGLVSLRPRVTAEAKSAPRGECGHVCS